mmetsp:Transcript_7150/g.10552  ORF Transcript_7150/g.10552 Transcript_7150/m.10552 type:complete len:262 (-) Transcript_7150:2386-3171(-)
MPMPRLSCHDVFIGLAIFYAGAELVIAWENFNECKKPIQVWLLIACVTLGLFRTAHLLAGEDDDNFYEPWCFNLFSSRYKLHSIVVVGVLYPFFLGWILVGTLWYAEVAAQRGSCFKDQQQSWYFILWLVIFYIWIIAYTTAISISAMIYLRNREFESQYMQLVDQYGDSPAPQPAFQMQGLSPASIQSFTIEVVNTPQMGKYMCSVCLDEPQKREKLRVMPCGHKFHLSCIDGWLMRQSYCPNCKRNLRRQDFERPLLSF